MNHDKDLIYNQLENIKKSTHFNKSKISCDLLDYLVQTTLEGNNPKEYTIGIELFGKKYADDYKQDSKIRVYIHNLRKKLNDYYESDGIKDSLIFEVEKGKYNVKFHSRKQLKPKLGFNYKIAFSLLCLICIFLGTIIYVDRKTPDTPWQKLPVWQDFANSDKKTLLVFGDYFVFSGMLPTGRMGIFRDYTINSEVEYEHLLDKQPDLVQIISKTQLTYLSKMSVFCQNDIQRVFSQIGKNIEVKLASDMQPEDLKSYNIIYIGNYKNMGMFENVVNELEFNFGIRSGDRQYIKSKDPKATVYSANNTDLKQNDYSLVISLDGYSDNYYLFFLSTQDIGNISTVGQFTNPDYLKQFQESHPKASNNFKALFKVEGIDKTDLGSELIRVEK
ncbi:helix-turn-helix domain-containing protein [Sunxiuqinia sp. A32]|uniref:helix-turn-helix domain-containing protein n=1 Tax=Sunxiuqinia sp. A32 TaxID=3461496 RepID=UPI004046580C